MEIPGMNRLKFKINVQQNARSIHQRPYSYSQEARAEIEQKIQEMLEIKLYVTQFCPGRSRGYWSLKRMASNISAWTTEV